MKWVKDVFLSKDIQMANDHAKTVIREMQIYSETPLHTLMQTARSKNTVTSADGRNWNPPPLLVGILKNGTGTMGYS